MHVLMTADTVGGVWNYSMDLIKSLDKNHVNFTLVTMGAPLTSAQRNQVRKLNNVNLKETKFRLEWMDSPWVDVELSGEFIMRLSQDIKADLLHLNGFSHGALEVKIPKMVVAHSCLFSWWKAVKSTVPPEAYTQYYSRVQEGLLLADHVVAPSYSILQQINFFYGALEKQAVIPNGINLENYSPEAKTKMIFSAGRVWDEAKNIAALEEASAKITWPFFVAGSTKKLEGTTTSEFKRLKLLGVLNNKQMQDYLSKSAIYALPAKYEPFGLSILEAAASGCALVLGDIPSLKENWEGAAIFADPGNTKEITEAIEYLIQHDKIRNELADKARERASGFSLKSFSDRYYQLYENLLKQHKPTNIISTKQHEHQAVLS